MQESLSTFGSIKGEYETEYMTDITCDVEYTDYGFIKDGKINGFFFSERYIYLPYQDKPEKFYFAGIQDGKYEDWFLFKLKNECTKIVLQGNPHPDILIEREGENITFFGMQKDGKPEGLGFTVTHNEDKTKTLNLGYYSQGILTHSFKDGTLIPL